LVLDRQWHLAYTLRGYGVIVVILSAVTLICCVMMKVGASKVALMEECTVIDRRAFRFRKRIDMTMRVLTEGWLTKRIALW
jgi:hypothetical protein